MARPSARSSRRPSRGSRRLAAPRPRLRAAALLVLAVAVGIGLAFVLGRGGNGGDAGSGPAGDPDALAPGAAPGAGRDPLAWTKARDADVVARATLGLAHPLFAFSPGGAVASARRVAALRPLIERAAGDGEVVDADTLEGLVFLESAGRPDAQASDDLDGAAGLTQILAETGRNLLDLNVDVAASAKLTRGIRRGTNVAEREAQRRRVDERFDPAKALAATVRYLDFARGKLGDRLDLAVASYHMGVGNLQNVLSRFDDGETVPYSELFFSASPVNKPAAHDLLSGFGDDSSTYLWRVDAAKAIMRSFRDDPDALQRTATLQTNKNSAEEVLHPKDTTRRFTDAGAIADAVDDGTLKRLDADQLSSWGVRIDSAMGELAPRLGEPRTRYRALRPEALALLRYLGTGVRTISGATKPLVLTSTVRDDDYQELLTRQNIEATKSFSLHTTGFTFDVLRRYENRKQALAFQFLLDRLTALNLIAWVREPAAIHITVAADASQALTAGP